MATINFKRIAKQFGTPLYIYEAERIKENLSKIINSAAYPKSKIYFAAMCNNQPEVLKIIKDQGVGIQINSEHELYLAKNAGFISSDISFTSTGISKELMKKLIEESIEINLDSVEEVEKFCTLIKNKSFGIRVKIDKKIKINSNEATNFSSDSNVGIQEKDFNKIKKISKKTGNKITGVHGYLASNLIDTKPFLGLIIRSTDADFVSISAFHQLLSTDFADYTELFR